MDTEAFLRDLEERRDRISQAISLLKGNAHRNGRRRGRRKGTFSAAADGRRIRRRRSNAAGLAAVLQSGKSAASFFRVRKL